MVTTLKSELPTGLMKGYDSKGFFDEMFDKSGEVFPHYR